MFARVLTFVTYLIEGEILLGVVHHPKL